MPGAGMCQTHFPKRTSAAQWAPDVQHRNVRSRFAVRIGGRARIGPWRSGTALQPGGSTPALRFCKNWADALPCAGRDRMRS